MADRYIPVIDRYTRVTDRYTRVTDRYSRVTDRGICAIDCCARIVSPDRYSRVIDRYTRVTDSYTCATDRYALGTSEFANSKLCSSWKSYSDSIETNERHIIQDQPPDENIRLENKNDRKTCF